jgi:ABC-type multidrug transport system ATPase subunit
MGGRTTILVGAQDALSGIEFSIRPGEVVGVIGRVGAGKTTVRARRPTSARLTIET